MTWLIEGIVIILASFIVGVIIGRAIKSVNGDDD
jgi:uncharacterized integral membrane protein